GVRAGLPQARPPSRDRRRGELEAHPPEPARGRHGAVHGQVMPRCGCKGGSALALALGCAAQGASAQSKSKGWDPMNFKKPTEAELRRTLAQRRNEGTQP